MMTAIFSPHLFSGKTVLVTGGGSGIGFAIAQLFGELGATVLIAARDQERLQEAKQVLQQHDISVHSYAVNIRENDSVEQLFTAIESQSLRVDVLVNNAGGQFVAPALDISPNGFKAVVELNLQGTFQMSQRFARHCQEGGHGGNIINVVLCQESGIPGMAHAAAARAGVVNLTKTLAWEWAPLQIRVNAIAPGTIETEGLKNYDVQVLQQGLTKLPIARVGQASEIACSVAYLASPAASFITGICLAQDGGEHLTGATPQY
ncbi:SDR family oxidoreductase [Paenalcaligenes sp. Me131]|uniref:SDR family oxidoreductase n=1 Tax=Paenalcaligenes sp. Me131 TaxID=3392636 RepID=UPI003D2BBFE3